MHKGPNTAANVNWTYGRAYKDVSRTGIAIVE